MPSKLSSFKLISTTVSAKRQGTGPLTQTVQRTIVFLSTEACRRKKMRTGAFCAPMCKPNFNHETFCSIRNFVPHLVPSLRVTFPMAMLFLATLSLGFSTDSPVSTLCSHTCIQEKKKYLNRCVEMVGTFDPITPS